MSKEKYTALLLGATGLIGSDVLSHLLINNKYETVYIIVRKLLPISHPKLIQIIGDQETAKNKIEDIKVTHFYSCIGSTKKKTPNIEAYYKIDLQYPLTIAKHLKNNGCTTMAIISSVGANEHSKNFYLKLKGDVEAACKALHFDSTIILRPSLLIGKRKEQRLLEGFTMWLSPVLDLFLVGKLKNYKSIKASVVAKAMINLVLSNKQGTHIYQSVEIKKNA